MRGSCAAALAVAVLAQLAAATMVRTVFPTGLAIGCWQQLQLLVDEAPPTLALHLDLPDGSAANVTATKDPTATRRMLVTLPPVNATGIGKLVQAAGTGTPLPLVWYRFPAFNRSSSAGAVTSAGLTNVYLWLQPGQAVHAGAQLSVLVKCGTFNATGGTGMSVRSAQLQPDGSVVSGHNVVGAYEYTAQGALQSNANGSYVVFYAHAVPNSPVCASASVHLSLVGGYIYHYTGLTLQIAPVSPIIAVSLYPYLITASPWVATHNRARIEVSSLFTAAVDTKSYFEAAWRVPALPTGKLVDGDYFALAIQNLSAALVICAGTQFQATALTVTAANPNVNVLIMSTLRQVLPQRPNLAFATGRMYEAMYLAGIVAASVSKTGQLGYLMSLDSQGSYPQVNAFLLGARAAIAAGVASCTNVTVHAWLIGAFSNDWAEKNAAIDLLDRYNVDVLFPVTDNPSPQLECHARGCYSIGYNNDERQTLGDRVLISTLFQLTPIYIEFASRMVRGDAFGPDSYMGGLSRGVEIASMSPVVPLAAQRLVTSAAQAMRDSPDLQEKVFCTQGTLLDAAGNTRFDASALPADYQTGGIGVDATLPCMPLADINSMAWMIQGAHLFGLYSPPPVPTGPTPSPWVVSLPVIASTHVVALLTLFLAFLFSVAVIWWRYADSIRYASPLFLCTTAIGAAGMAFVLISMSFTYGSGGANQNDILPSVTLSDATCIADMWVSGISFVLLFGSLFAKTYRIHRLFNNRQLRKLRLSSSYVGRLIFMCLLLELALLLIMTLVFPRSAANRVVQLSGSTQQSQFRVCTGTVTSSNPSGIDGYVILNALHLLLLVWGAYLALRVRDVPLGFNESRYIGMSIYNAFLCEIVTLIIGSSTDSSPATQFYAATIRLGVAPLVTLLLLFLPKFVSAARGATDNMTSDGFYVLKNGRPGGFAGPGGGSKGAAAPHAPAGGGAPPSPTAGPAAAAVGFGSSSSGSMFFAFLLRPFRLNSTQTATQGHLPLGLPAEAGALAQQSRHDPGGGSGIAFQQHQQMQQQAQLQASRHADATGGSLSLSRHSTPRRGANGSSDRLPSAQAAAAPTQWRYGNAFAHLRVAPIVPTVPGDMEIVTGLDKGVTGVLDRTVVGEPFAECTPEADGSEQQEVSGAGRDQDQDEEQGIWGEHNEMIIDPAAAEGGSGAADAAVVGVRSSPTGAAASRPGTEQRGSLRLSSPEASSHDAGAMALDSPADPMAARPRHLALPTPSSRGDGDGEVFDEGASSRGRGGIISWLFGGVGGGGTSSSRVHPLPAVLAARCNPSQPSQASTGANSHSSSSSGGTNPAPISGGSGLAMDPAGASGTVPAPASGATAAAAGSAAPHVLAPAHPVTGAPAPLAAAAAATAPIERAASQPRQGPGGMLRPVAAAVSAGSGTTGSDLVISRGDSLPSTASSSVDGVDRPWSEGSSGAAVDDDAIRRDALVVAPFNMLSTVREVTEASVLDI